MNFGLIFAFVSLFFQLLCLFAFVDVVMCIDHPEMRCDCDASAHCLVYRYTLDELESLLLVLKGRADQLDDWQQRARAALEAKTEKKKGYVLKHGS